MFLDLPARLAKVLLKLADNAPKAPQGRKIAMTQREIGQFIGMSRRGASLATFRRKIDAPGSWARIAKFAEICKVGRIWS
jgi:CRP-like cAMP-binding protein